MNKDYERRDPNCELAILVMEALLIDHLPLEVAQPLSNMTEHFF